MKPNFALNLSDTSIALLHRTAKGWTQIGETPFDAPDLAEALDYLRKTALGLEPGGIATKLVIPNSQILYAEISAPGPSEDERRAQIQAELEDRTPYRGDEIAFDFSGRGKVVKIAAVARETLAEAEAFATEHRFNPVSFVAIPEAGSYSGEPWFGTTEAAKATLAPGEVVERDRSAIALPGARAAAAEAKAAAMSAPVADAAGPEADAAAVADAPKIAPTTEAVPEAEAEPKAEPRAETAPRTEAKPEAPPAPVVPPAAPVAAPQAELPFAPTPAAPIASEAAKPAPALAPEKTDTAAAAAMPTAEAKAEAKPEPIPAPAAPSSAPAEAAAEEAPFTHVAEPDPAEPVPPPASPPAPVAAASPAPAASPSSRSAGVNAPSLPPEEDDDLPPAPAGAVMAALSRSRAADTSGLAETRRSPAAPAVGRPDAAALARAARGKPIEDLPPVPRPAQAAAPSGLKPGPRAGGIGLGGAAPKGLGGLITAPSIPGTRKAKAAKPSATAARPAAAAPGSATPATAPSASDAARSLSRSPFAQPQRGRTRHLGLILTAILLLCLALVAAWSSLYLASSGDPAQPVVAGAETDMPAIEDEMLADGQDAEAFDPATAPDPAETGTPEAAPEALADAAPAPEAAPETGLTDGAPAAVALVDGQDEIFLAGSEAPPPAFDALSLPNPDPAVDALPMAPMPPPPPGTVYQFDADGLIVPMPAGIPSPAGFMLYAGKPKLVPPPRSAVAEAAAAAAAAAAATVEAPAGPPAAVTAGADGALVEAAPVGAPAAEPAAAPTGPEAQPNPDLANRRPKARPEALVPATAGDDAALTGDAAVQVAASLRPRNRPATVLAAAERARAETAAASLAAPVEGGAEAASVTPASAAATDGANPSLLAISRRPAEKPRDFSRAVEAAVAAAVRSPAPEPEPAPAAKSASAKAPKGDLKPDEQSEIDEPEVASAVAPKIPTKASVAKTATYKNAINLSKTNLIGVYGTASKRYALVRTSNGKYKKVKVGDRIDGGTIQAITQSELRYQKGGRLLTLAMPKG